MNLRLPCAALLATLACDAGEPASEDPSKPSLLHEATMWTQSGSFGDTACDARRSLPGCDGFPEPELRALAVDGRRLAAAIDGVLIVSDDLGQTVRQFPLRGLPADSAAMTLHLHAGRIFLLVPGNSASPAAAGANLFEVDATRGSLMPRGNGVSMSGIAPLQTADGVLTSVAFGRDRPPQVIAVTRFDPRTGSITRAELPCTVTGCNPASLAWPFLSSDGDTFDALVEPAGDPGRPSCLLSVRRSTGTVTSECHEPLMAGSIAPVSSFGGQPYDFLYTSVGYAGPSSLVPVERHWLPAGPAIQFGADQLAHVGQSLFVFDPSGKPRLLRLRAGGKLQETTLSHQGCLNLGPYVRGDGCPRVVSYRALADDQILFVTQRDQFPDDETRSRQIFEVVRSSAPFTDFRRP
jgi:hypothetical protein